MIITLCGFMGSGKSSLGRGLATAFNCRFIDLDDYIEAKWDEKEKEVLNLADNR